MVIGYEEFEACPLATLVPCRVASLPSLFDQFDPVV